MSRVPGCQGDPFKDEVPNVEVLGFHHCIILHSHKTFVSCCPLLYIRPYRINKIEVKTKLFFIVLVLILHHPVVGHVYFYRYDCFTSIS